MKEFLKYSLIALSLVVSGCSAVTVDHDSLAGVDFSTMKNYSWLNGDSGSEVKARNPKVNMMVMSSVGQQLKNKGYNRTTEENADFYVTWFGKVDEKVSQQSISHFYRTSGYGVLAGQYPEAVEAGGGEKTYLEGTLILDVIEAKSNKVIWRGSAADTIREGMSDAEIAAYIQRSVSKILAPFPSH